jgi:hypothetical protein
LSEQQRIYEESTRAAEERLKVAKEAVKSSVFGGDSKDLTGFYNMSSKALEIIAELIEAFGGLRGILWTVGAVLINLY